MTAIDHGVTEVRAATLGEQLCRFAARVVADGAPQEVRSVVRQRVLDTVGIAVSASAAPDTARIVDHLVARGGREEAHVIGRLGRVPAAQAAFANGVLAHSLDYDDTHLPSILHPSASVVPAALAVAEREGASGTALLDAVAVGLEVCVRVGMAGYDAEARNSTYFDRGQHATSMCGALGAAVAASVLSGGDADAALHALGVAASMASGIIEANRTGGTVKRIHCGWAAHAGVEAADLVAAGVTGPPTVLEGRFGFFQAFLTGHFDVDAVTEGLGRRWEAARIHVKPYPANHFTHTGADAAIELRERGVRPQDVAELVLHVADPTVRTIGEPLETKRAPESGYAAKFSGPFVVAAALSGGGGLGLAAEDFSDERASDPQLRELMARISVVGDERCAAIYPDEFPAILEATLTDGSRRVIEVLHNRGGPGNPLTDAEIMTKFLDNVASRVSAGRADELARQLLDIGDAPDVAAVAAAVAAATADEG